MGVLTPRPPGKSPSEGRRLPPMATPLQAARLARGWSQARMVSELMRLAEVEEDRRCVGCQPQNPALPVGERARHAGVLPGVAM